VVFSDAIITPPTIWTPVSIANATAISLERSNYLKYQLQEGKQYHAFLVGKWSETDSQTDYDIYVNGPGGLYRFTEATGMPEQVSNDDDGQFFTPTVGGEYTFEIHNDEGDSNSSDPAVFMLIEHIETDEVYEVYLKGRNTKCDDYTSMNTYSYEFTTSSKFTIYVDTPDDLDMFEARLYPMAGGSVGYDINGVPTPTGEMVLGKVTGSYGGYDPRIIGGYKWPALTASGVTYGDKLTIQGGGGGITTYFLVLIAEYSKPGAISSVPFYIKTSTVEPTLDLNGNIGEVYAGETKKVSAVVSSPRTLKNVWMNFIVNGEPSEQIVYLSGSDDIYEGEMPAFAAGDVVNWKIFAEDELGDVGHIGSSFTVVTRPAPTTVRLSLDSQEIKVNQELRLSGAITPPVVGVVVDVTLVSAGTVKTETLTTKADGSFSFATPLVEGEWDVLAQVRGNSKYATSSSGILKANVLPLTVVDQALALVLIAVGPPYIYGLLLVSVVVVVLVVRWKMPGISSRLPKPIQSLLGKVPSRRGARVKKVEAGSKGRYRRQEEG